MRMTNPNMPRQPMQPNPRKPRSGVAPMTPKPLGSVSPRPLITPGKPSPTGMKKGGMATKKKAGKISEYGGKEMYSSKKGMMKHEGMESMKMEKSEGKMKQGGMAKKGRGLAVMIAIGKPKGRGK